MRVLREIKGSAMVEAALLLPLVISCTGLLISITVQSYVSVSSKTAADLALSRESGMRSETIFSGPGGETPREQNIMQLQEQIHWGIGYTIYPLLQVEVDRPELEETLYYYDEAEYIRLADLF